MILWMYTGISQAQKHVSIAVDSAEMQEILGLGFSIHKAKGYFLPADPNVFHKLYTETFAGMNAITFWSYIENPVERDRLITEGMKYGLKRVVANPTGEPQTPGEHAENVFNEIKEYMAAGYPVYGTTIMNKPNTDESGTLRQDPAFLTEAAKLIRHMLDSAGYGSVKIGGPSTIEWAPYIDPVGGGAAHGYSFQAGDNLAYLQAFLDDTAALKVLDAIDYQSYGWSIDNHIQHIADSLGKELWITLSATDGYQNNNGDPILATISAANILANLNHGVSYWTHWVWDQLSNFNTGEPNTRMKYMQQIGRNIPEGAVMRRCTADDSQPTPDMYWNYFDLDNPGNFIQPEIVAAASMNPDTTMTIAIVNLSGIRAQHFYSEYVPQEAALYQASLHVEDLVDFPSIQAVPVICNNEGNISEGTNMEFKNGDLDLSISSKDLLLLRTAKLMDPQTSGEGMFMASDHVHWNAYPNPFVDLASISAFLEACHVRIRIFNIQGKLVFDGPQHSHAGGKYEFTWNATDQPSGIYLTEIRINYQYENRLYRIKMLKR